MSPALRFGQAWPHFPERRLLFWHWLPLSRDIGITHAHTHACIRLLSSFLETSQALVTYPRPGSIVQTLGMHGLCGPV